MIFIENNFQRNLLRMLKEKALLKEYYSYLKSMFQKFEEAFQTTSNELIDMRLAILVIKGYSKEYYKNPDEDIYDEFHEESKKYIHSIRTIKEKSKILQREINLLKAKRNDLEDSSSYSTKQDEILNIIKDIQKDFENVYPIIEEDILKVQVKYRQKILAHGVNPSEDFGFDQMEEVYDKTLENINQGMKLAKQGNKQIKDIKTKIEQLNQDKSFDKLEQEEDQDTTTATEEEEKDIESEIDKRIVLKLNKVKTKAYMRIRAVRKAQNKVSEGDIREVLKEQNITHGLIEENIKYIAETQPRRNVLVARGEEPTGGTNAHIEYKVDLSHESRGFEDAESIDESVDFKDAQAYKTIDAGTVIAEKIPPKKGKDGVDVHGEIIPSKEGDDVDFKLGENVELSEDGLKVLSSIEGIAFAVKGVLSVSNTLIIPKDVDYSTGNIKFSGDVIIGGDVLDEFEVYAKGNITIKGNIYQAKVESAEGNIRVVKGINGDEGNALIKAKGTIQAKYIEGAKIYCGGDLIVHTDIMHSTVYANGNVICIKGKGLIVGGYIGMGKILECNVMGSPSYTPTTVDLGVNMKLREEQYGVVKRLADAKEYIIKARNLLEKIKNKYRRKKIDKKNYRRYINIKRAHNSKLEEFNNIKAEFDELEEEKYKTIAEAQLIVRKTTYPKVEVRGGKIYKNMKTETNYPALYWYDDNEGEIRSRRVMPDEGFFEEDISYTEDKTKKEK